MTVFAQFAGSTRRGTSRALRPHRQREDGARLRDACHLAGSRGSKRTPAASSVGRLPGTTFADVHGLVASVSVSKPRGSRVPGRVARSCPTSLNPTSFGITTVCATPARTLRPSRAGSSVGREGRRSLNGASVLSEVCALSRFAGRVRSPLREYCCMRQRDAADRLRRR